MHRLLGRLAPVAARWLIEIDTLLAIEVLDNVVDGSAQPPFRRVWPAGEISAACPSKGPAYARPSLEIDAALDREERLVDVFWVFRVKASEHVHCVASARRVKRDGTHNSPRN